MNTPLIRIATAGLFFVFIFLSGFWLSRSGKPYSSLALNIHKLIALAAVVFLFVTIRKLGQVTKLNSTELTISLVTGLLFIGAIISGGLVSIDKSMPAVVPVLHKLLPWLVVLATGLALYLSFRLRG